MLLGALGVSVAAVLSVMTVWALADEAAQLFGEDFARPYVAFVGGLLVGFAPVLMWLVEDSLAWLALYLPLGLIVAVVLLGLREGRRLW